MSYTLQFFTHSRSLRFGSFGSSPVSSAMLGAAIKAKISKPPQGKQKFDPEVERSSVVKRG